MPFEVAIIRRDRVLRSFCDFVGQLGTLPYLLQMPVPPATASRENHAPPRSRDAMRSIHVDAQGYRVHKRGQSEGACERVDKTSSAPNAVGVEVTWGITRPRIHCFRAHFSRTDMLGWCPPCCCILRDVCLWVISFWGAAGCGGR